MKKHLLFAAVATMFAACSTDTTEDVAVNCLPYDVLHVSVGDEDESRIQLDGNCRTVWNEGDKVSVFNKTNGNECWQFDGKTGDRSGTLSKVSGSAGSKTNKVVALYPYDSNCAVSGNMISTTIPATQTYRADSFGDGGNIMVAVSDDNELQFNHIFGWIRLNLTDDQSRKVSQITLNGNNDEKLTGSIVIDTGSQKMYMNGNSTSTVTLDCGEGVQLSKTVPIYFYIAVLPQTFAKGVSVKINMTDGTSLKKNYEESFAIIRNHIQPIKVCNFQSSCDMIFYTTTDGKPVAMERNEGFGANFISNTYENGQGIIQFNGNITSIPEHAFFCCETLTSISIPDSVTKIRYDAFYGCGSLTSVTIPDSVTVIGGCAFEYCSSLTSITIPDSVTSIERSTFGYCSSLTSITIPDSVTEIGYDAFAGCSSLKSITIGDSVTSIGDSAFWGCSSLTSINIPDSVTSIGKSAFSRCSSLATFYGRYSSSDSRCLIIDGKLIAFAPFGLTEYIIPDGIKSIARYVFSGSNLTSITIPDSVTEIGYEAFAGCSSLTNITIPDSVTSIGDSAFSGCSSLTSVTIPDSVTSIGSGTFKNCSSLTSVTIPDSVTSIGSGAFEDCSSLTSVTIPNSVTSIENYAFDGCCSLTSVTIPDSVTSIGKSVFRCCWNLFLFLGKYSSSDFRCLIMDGELIAFAPFGLTEYIIPDDIKSIASYVFYDSDLTSITIPDSVTDIGSSAFEECTHLTSIYCKPSIPPTLGACCFDYISGSAKIYVPMSSIGAYKWADGWNDYKSKIVGYDF